MSEFNQRVTDRLRVMLAVYEAARGDTTLFVNLWDVREALGLDDTRMADAVSYLEEKGLINTILMMTGQRHGRIERAGVAEMERAGRGPSTAEEPRTPPRAVVTSSGLSELAQAERMPNLPTQYLPPYNSVTINVSGSVYGSPMQVASPGASQNVETRVETVAAGDVNRVRAFLTEYSAGGHGLRLAQELESDAYNELIFELATLNAQIPSPRPKAAIIRLSASTIRKLIARAPGEQTSTLLRLLDQIDV